MLNGFYGDPLDGVSVNLRRAYRDFQAWRKLKKVNITQGVWKFGYVTRTDCADSRTFNHNKRDDLFEILNT